MFDNDELICRVALTSVLGVGPKMFDTLLLTFGSAQAVFEAQYASFSDVPRFSRKLYEEIQLIDRHAIQEQVRQWQRQGIIITVKGADDYPRQLIGIPDAPSILFCSRRWDNSWDSFLAIVGTRHPTKSSCFFAEHIATQLAANGFTIVSGMATGIDRCAHLGTLKAGGRTIAVLGNGILIPFPPENKDIYTTIAKHGILMSEHMPNVSPNAGTLIARNRIIAGISDLTIVVEAQRRGGTIETGMKTLNMNKKLLVYDTNSSGNRFLLRQGGIPIRHVQQVLDYMD